MINYIVNQNIAIITWAMTSSPMNVLNDESIPEFEAALRKAHADEAVTGIIITSTKPEFIAGADLKMILRNNDKEPAEMLKVSAKLNRVFRSIETSGKPTVAAMNGTALGGGYELCLGCHHRIALANPKTLIGLVEVTIGLLPGGGGTQRLPRMIGIQPALTLMLEGKKAGVQEALTLGLVDDIADTPEQLMDKSLAWIAANLNPVKPWDEIDRKTGNIVGKDNFRVPGGNVQSAVGMQMFSAGTAMLMEETKGNYPAPLAIMACVYEGLQVNIDRALVIEGRYFVQVATSNVAKGMIQTTFLGLNEINKGLSRPKGVPKTDVQKVGILGLGAVATCLANLSVRVGIAVVQPNDIGQNGQNCELIIEAISENQTRNHTPTWPEKTVGIHSLLPIAKAQLVEIIVNSQTTDNTLAAAFDYVRKLRKTPIVVSDSPGFYLARCAETYQAEGLAMLNEGINPVLIQNGGIDAGMPNGPLPATDSLPTHTIPQAKQQPTLEEVKTRLLYRQSIEAMRCLNENVVRTKVEADLGSILGWGFPAYTGGAISFIDFVGADAFISTCNRLADTYGERFRLNEEMLERIISTNS